MLGSEVVLLIKMKIQSLKVLVETKALERDWMRERYKRLGESLDYRSEGLHLSFQGVGGVFGFLVDGSH